MATIPITPPGLEYLAQASSFQVIQTRSSMFQSYCTYDLLGPEGHLIYQGLEVRECCGPRMDVRVQDTQGYNVLNLNLPANFCSWDTTLQISSSSGEILGYIDKKWTSFSASFDILNASHQVCLKVKGPGWGEGFMSDANYQVMSADKSFSVGLITRVWRGIGKEIFNTTDKYAVQFPKDLDATMKAILLACTIFIDLLMHEERRNQK